MDRSSDSSRRLLGLYPYDFRAAFEMEMLEAFERAGHPAAELAGLIRGAAAEWFAMMRPAGMPRELWFGRNACLPDTSR